MTYLDPDRLTTTQQRGYRTVKRDRLLILAALADAQLRLNLPEPEAVTFVDNRPTVIAVRLVDYALWTRALDANGQAHVFRTLDGATHYYHVGNLVETDVAVRIATTRAARQLVDVSP